jgi:hypothetical protein
MSVRIRNIVAQMQVVDGDSLLTPQVTARIVAAVMHAMEVNHEDERARQRDTKVAGGGCCNSCESESGGMA